MPTQLETNVQLYTLKLSPIIANEWLVRSIGSVIPQLDDYAIEPGRKIMVDRATVNEIVADCKFMTNPKAVDASPAERRAYRAMRAQCEQALAIGPVEVSEEPNPLDDFGYVGSRHHY